LALVDLNLIECGPAETLAYFTKLSQLAWLVISQEEDMALVKETLRLGAQDYLFKAWLSANLLEKSLLYAWERHQGQMEKSRLASQSFVEQSRELAFSSTQGAYVVRTDLEGRYTFYNDLFARTFIPGKENKLGCNGMAHILPEDHPKTLAAVQECLASPGSKVRLDIRKPTEFGIERRSSWELPRPLQA
jgi:Response regulator of citrate/malate metabolism